MKNEYRPCPDNIVDEFLADEPIIDDSLEMWTRKEFMVDFYNSSGELRKRKSK